MRFLLACAACQRQYDASELPLGSLFHCLCGEKIKVPELKAADAAVVRCSSCGGPRIKDALSCTYCNADFTLIERKLQTVCPSCMARVADDARFCHHCGTTIAPQGEAGKQSECRCPLCGYGQRLNNRELGDPGLAVLECPRCAGMWLGQDVLKSLLDRARQEHDARVEAGDGPQPAPRRPGGNGQQGTLYRKCPICTRHMNRGNWGRRSGVIVDRCKQHGIWLDADELEGILNWIRRGGEARTRQTSQDEQRQAASRKRFDVLPKTPEGNSSFGERDRDRIDLVGGLVGRLFGF